MRYSGQCWGCAKQDLCGRDGMRNCTSYVPNRAARTAMLTGRLGAWCLLLGAAAVIAVAATRKAYRLGLREGLRRGQTTECVWTE